MLEIVREPWVEEREAVLAREIAVTTPMKGLFQVADRLWRELSQSLAGQGMEEAGPSYLRFRIIDMEGDMAISVGVPVKDEREAAGRVVPVLLPSGTYACLRYIGHGLTANKLLLNWIRDRNLTMDRWDEPRGDAFRNRRESVLTDRRLEPHKKKWTMELSIKLKS